MGARHDSLPARCRLVVGAFDPDRMPAPRQTFLVEVHEDGGAVIENVRTRECTWLSGLSEVGAQITSWLEEPDRPASRRPTPTAQPPRTRPGPSR